MLALGAMNETSRKNENEMKEVFVAVKLLSAKNDTRLVFYANLRNDKDCGTYNQVSVSRT